MSESGGRGPSRPPPHLAGMTRAERRDAVAELGMKSFRADQVSRHWFGRLETDPDKWTDLSAADRSRLAAALAPTLLTEIATRVGDGGETTKTSWELHDGAAIESVVMCYRDRATVCVSTQVGCGMGCEFCATGHLGLGRNLGAAEIVQQVVAAARGLAADPGAGTSPARRVSNVVFMGMGEPLANYDATVRALRILSAPVPDGLGISARSLTVSTVGLVPKIDRLAGEGIPCTLAISLHAPDDDLRDRLVPINRRWPIAELLAAADRYRAQTRRRVSIEYALIGSINDSPSQARDLGRVLAGRGLHVNLIPMNPIGDSDWAGSAAPVVERFGDLVREAGVEVTVRRTRGRDIDGACGQLARAGRRSGRPV